MADGVYGLSGLGMPYIPYVPKKTNSNIASIYGASPISSTSQSGSNLSKIYGASPLAQNAENLSKIYGASPMPTATRDTGGGSSIVENPVITNTEIGDVNGSPALGGGGIQIAPDTWTPIPIPDMNVQLTPAQLASLLNESKQFGDLKYDPLLTQYGIDSINNQKWGVDTIASEKPEWYSSMRNIANQVANALGDYATKTNMLGRFESGQLGAGIEGIKSSGINNVSALESGLTKRIGGINDMVKSKEDSIATLKAGVEREKGLTVALQNATLQREAIQNEKETRSRMFDMALASASDTRDQQRLTIAKNEFTAKIDEMLYQRTVTERSLAMQAESAALENALTQKQIDGYNATISGYSSGPGENEFGYYTDPTTGLRVPVKSTSDLERVLGMQGGSNLPSYAETWALKAQQGVPFNVIKADMQSKGLTPAQIDSYYQSIFGASSESNPWRYN